MLSMSMLYFFTHFKIINKYIVELYINIDYEYDIVNNIVLDIQPLYACEPSK